MFIPDTKPECRICREERSGLGEDLVRDLLYSLFNPYYREIGNVRAYDFIKKYLKNEELKQFFENFAAMLNEIMRGYRYINAFWTDKIEDYERAKKMAWNEIKEKIKRGELKREDLSASELVNYFYEEIVEELMKEGYIDKSFERFNRVILKFTPQAERLIGMKILQLSLQNLKRTDFGEHETEKIGISNIAGYRIIEYDPYVHTFDLIDIQETFVKCALRNPKLEFEERDLVARSPKHLEKCVYVMLIDVSDSMRGKKIIGAIESALALKTAIKKRDLDELHVIAFNHQVRRVREEDIINLTTRGRTDIGLALKKARDILKRRRGSGVVFLITDGEPTSSYDPYLTPSRCALREAEKLRTVDAMLTIVMLGKDRRFLELCNRMAKANGKSNLIYFADPLDMKKFFVRTYMRRR